MDTTTVAEVMAELAELEDPKAREVNARHGDDHGVNLGALRALAKRLKTQHDLARQLWATGDASARLLAILICRPRRSSGTSWTSCCARRAPRRCTTGW